MNSCCCTTGMFYGGSPTGGGHIKKFEKHLCENEKFQLFYHYFVSCENVNFRHFHHYVALPPLLYFPNQSGSGGCHIGYVHCNRQIWH